MGKSYKKPIIKEREEAKRPRRKEDWRVLAIEDIEEFEDLKPFKSKIRDYRKDEREDIKLKASRK